VEVRLLMTKYLLAELQPPVALVSSVWGVGCPGSPQDPIPGVSVISTDPRVSLSECQPLLYHLLSCVIQGKLVISVPHSPHL
jgi:hypothetical protein